MKRVLVLLALPLALVLAACGGTDVLPRDAVVKAADRTAEQKSSKFEMSMQMSVPGIEQRLRVFATGAMDYVGQRGRVDMDMGGLAAMFGGSGQELKMSMIFDYPTMYMKLPQALAQGNAPATPWVKVDLSKATGMELGDLSQFSQNPADQLEMLRAASDDVEERGEKTVRGVKTTRYHAVLDVERAAAEGLKNVPAERREAAQRALDAMAKQSGLDKIPLDVYLDGDGVLRRMFMDMTVAIPGQQQKLRLTTTMDLFDFGADVDVEPPPASQVTDVTSQLPAAGG